MKILDILNVSVPEDETKQPGFVKTALKVTWETEKIGFLQRLANWEPLEEPAKAKEPKGPGIGRRIAGKAGAGLGALVVLLAEKQMEKVRNRRANQNNNKVVSLTQYSQDDAIEGEFTIHDK